MSFLTRTAASSPRKTLRLLYDDLAWFIDEAGMSPEEYWRTQRSELRRIGAALGRHFERKAERQEQAAKRK